MKNYPKYLMIFIIISMMSGMFACSVKPRNDDKKNKNLIGISQYDLDFMADNLQVLYTVIDNWPDELCHHDKAVGVCFQAEIKLLANKAINKKINWKLYFSHIFPIQSFTSDEFGVRHINGDLHVITPRRQYSGFASGESKVINFRASNSHLSESDMMPNYYLAVPGLKPVVIKSTQLEIDPESGLEILPHVKPISNYSKYFRRNPEDQTKWATSSKIYQANKGIKNDLKNIVGTIIPTPQKILMNPEEKKLDLTKGIKINSVNVQYQHINAAFKRLTFLGIKENLSSAVTVNLQIVEDSEQTSGAYSLKITDNKIDIIGVDAAGVFYALQSVASLINLDQSYIPQMQVEDQPRYSFRGLHLDIARNFHSKELVLDLLDQMAAYKLNKLHLHLADDEGWRLEIKGLPELTDIGSQRCYDLTETQCLLPQLGSGPHADAEVNGYYTVQDYLEILQAASARHIQVIPSLNMPGHAHAAVKAMQARYKKFMVRGDNKSAIQYLLSDPNDKSKYLSRQNYKDNTINVCLESSYIFIEKVIDEVNKIHQQANHPLIRYHIGANEIADAWIDSPECKKMFIRNHLNFSKDSHHLSGYFIEQVAEILSRRKIQLAAWSDGLNTVNVKNMPESVQSNAWETLVGDGHKTAHRQANKNWQVVVSTADVTNFNSPYEADPKERGYYWASRQINTRKVFEFMPDNLPAHGEIWQDQFDNDMELDDSFQSDENNKQIYQPLKKNMTFNGLQAQLWSETIRSEQQLEYMLFPRLIALAERAWHKAEWEVPYIYAGEKYNNKTRYFTEEMHEQRRLDWQRFANVLGHRELAKLDKAGILYRIPTVGTRFKNGKLQANIIFPGLQIEYREYGRGERQWHSYQDNEAWVWKNIEIRALSADGKRKGRILRTQ